MYHALVAVDEENEKPDRLVDVVASLPEAERAVEATVLNVFKAVDVIGEGGTFDTGDVYDEAPVPETVNEVHRSLEERGVAASTKRRHGDPAEEILTEAKELDADVIVIGGRKRTPVGKAVFGSVSQSVLLEADRAVLSVLAE